MCWRSSRTETAGFKVNKVSVSACYLNSTKTSKQGNTKKDKSKNITSYFRGAIKEVHWPNYMLDIYNSKLSKLTSSFLSCMWRDQKFWQKSKKKFCTGQIRNSIENFPFSVVPNVSNTVRQQMDQNTKTRIAANLVSGKHQNWLNISSLLNMPTTIQILNQIWLVGGY